MVTLYRFASTGLTYCIGRWGGTGGIYPLPNLVLPPPPKLSKTIKEKHVFSCTRWSNSKLMSLEDLAP